MKNSIQERIKKQNSKLRFLRLLACLPFAVAVAAQNTITTYAATVYTSLNVEPIKGSINGVAEVLKGFALPICTIVFVVCGLAMMTGQQGRQWAKSTMLFAAVGMMIALFASALATALQTSFTPV